MKKKMPVSNTVNPRKTVETHTPKVFAVRQPSLDSAELVITTKTRASHVFALTHGQCLLLRAQIDEALLNWPEEKRSGKSET